MIACISDCRLQLLPILEVAARAASARQYNRLLSSDFRNVFYTIICINGSQVAVQIWSLPVLSCQVLIQNTGAVEVSGGGGMLPVPGVFFPHSGGAVVTGLNSGLVYQASQSGFRRFQP